MRIAPERASEVNRVLGGAGIYAGAITSGSDLESIFLSLTATNPAAAGAVGGWGERG